MQNQLFNEVLDDDEEIIWSGKPSFLPFILGGFGFLIFGIIWGIMDLKILQKPGFNLFMIIHTVPFWGSILNMIRLGFVFPNTAYAYTNKRVLIRGGFRGIDYKAIDFDKIQNIEINVNPIENYLKVGTIEIFSGETTSKGGSLTNDMIGIKEPYTVFKNLKKTSLDIKTDFSYPNDLRPKTNKGYKTQYRGIEEVGI